jgi:hypothetical protein
MSSTRFEPETLSAVGDQETLVTRWTHFNFREYLESREGKIWRFEDTLRMLDRSEQIDALIEQLMRAAGVEIAG